MIDAYIAISPELKNESYQLLLSALHKLKNLDNKPRFLLFSHGTNVKEEHQISLYNKLQSTIQKSAPASLNWHYKHFENNYFMSLPPLSVILGVETLFDDIHNGLAPESATAQRGVEAIVKHYDFLSKEKYGFEVSPKKSINNLGFYLLKQSKDEGLVIFKEMLKRYPNDAYSHHNLANAYNKLGNTQLAIFHQKNAVLHAKTLQTWHQKRHSKILKEYTKKLK
jgi:tetratricopeptide (TPR) repeat protein